MSMNVDKSYTTPDGNFYVGMTKDQAKQKGLYKKFVGMDFCDIDTNNDNVLSKFEIDEATIRQKKRMVIGGLGEALAGTALVTASALAEIPSCGLSSAGIGTGGTMLLDGFTRIGEALLLEQSGPGTTRLRSDAKQKIKSIFVK